MTVGDIERVGIEKIAETALELAWQAAKAGCLSFDVDVIDSGFVPGTGWPEPGAGCCHGRHSAWCGWWPTAASPALEVVECSPPYDWAEQTSLISA
jgi:agmatinase